MDSAWLVIAIVIAYMAVLALISYGVRRSSRTSKSFADGGRSFPAILIGLLLASEFIGTVASIGTAQKAFEVGISAAWSMAALAIGFILFSMFVAHRYNALGENTISGALASTYGNSVRNATSAIMVVALMVVCVAVYASGGAILAQLLEIDATLATVLVGVIASTYVVVGGMRSVVYTNVLHALVMLGGMIYLAFAAVDRVGGFGQLHAELPTRMFSLAGVGWAQIFAWLTAGIGAIFATQYIVQAITTIDSPRKARTAGVYSALVLLPYGILAALVGLCSVILYPQISSINALPAVVVDLNPVMAGFVVSGIAAALFGTIGAMTLGSATLLLRDFYQPYVNKTGDDQRDTVFIRVATFVIGVVPIPVALFATDVISVTFLAKSLRTTLAVLVIMMFFKPGFGTGRAALVSILAAIPATIGWYLAGNPFGVDNVYVAAATPLVCMSVAEVLKSRSRVDTAARAETSQADGTRRAEDSGVSHIEDPS